MNVLQVIFAALLLLAPSSLVATDEVGAGVLYPTQRTVVHGPDGAPLPLGAYPGELPVVEQRFVGDGGAQEPDLDFASDGSALYYSWVSESTGPANYENRNRVLRTSDGGHTWRDVTPPLLQADQAGDPVVYRDPLSGRVFVVGYHEYASMQFTDDGGETWTTTAPVLGLALTDFPRIWSVPAGDAPTVDYPSVLFLCYFSGIEQQCRRSLDGGLTWHPIPSPFLPSTTLNLRCGAWSDSRMAGSARDRTLYVPLILREGAATPEGYASCQDPLAAWGPYEIWVSLSLDLGLTWELVRVAAPFGDDVDAASDASVRIAVDAAGNAYLAYIGADARPKLTVSRDHGATWSEPIDVGAPGVTAAKLPSLAAGDAGRIALFYVGTTVPGGFDATEDAMAEATWHGYAAFSLDALAASPVFATTLASETTDPLRRGPCDGRCVLDPTDCMIDCSVGSPVAGMFDYTNTKLHPLTGVTWTALVDLCADACAAPGATSAAGASFRASVAVQVAGTPIVSGE